MKKVLIVVADYYEEISSSLLESAKKSLKKFSIKIIKFQVFSRYQLQFQKILKNTMDLLH